MGWLSFKRQENRKYLFKEGDLSIEYDESGLLKVYQKDKVVHAKQFPSATKAMMGVEPIYNKYKA